MRQIRNGVFETNSSSTHSICISKEPVKDENVPTYLNIRTDKDFGWETDCYNSPEEKAAYLCSVMEWCELDAEKEEFLNKLKNEFHIKISYKSKNGYVDHSGTDFFSILRVVSIQGMIIQMNSLMLAM